PTRVSATGRARSFVPPHDWNLDEPARAAADRLALATRPEPALDHPAIQVASGDYELALFFSCGPWDLAAPALIVQEAGGHFSDLDGGRSLHTGAMLFSNRRVHHGAVNVLAT